MKTWNQLFIRQGFRVQEEQPNVFNCRKETALNLDFLMKSLEKLSVSYTLNEGYLTVLSPVVSEKEWLKTMDFAGRGRGEGLWFRPWMEEPKIEELDTYLSGMIRQFHRLELHTDYCCDGHDKRLPTIVFHENVKMDPSNF
jgi:tripeptide aminopeptidase